MLVRRDVFRAIFCRILEHLLPVPAIPVQSNLECPVQVSAEILGASFRTVQLGLFVRTYLGETQAFFIEGLELFDRHIMGALWTLRKCCVRAEGLYCPRDTSLGPEAVLDTIDRIIRTGTKDIGKDGLQREHAGSHSADGEL